MRRAPGARNIALMAHAEFQVVVAKNAANLMSYFLGVVRGEFWESAKQMAMHLRVGCRLHTQFLKIEWPAPLVLNE